MLPLTSSFPTVDSPLPPHVLLDSGATGTFVASADVQHLRHSFQSPMALMSSQLAVMSCLLPFVVFYLSLHI